MDNFRSERYQALKLLVLTFVETRKKEINTEFIETFENGFGISLKAAEKMEILIESKDFLNSISFWFDFNGKKKKTAIESFFTKYYSKINSENNFEKSQLILFLLFVQFYDAEKHSEMFEKYEIFLIAFNRHIENLVIKFNLNTEELNSIKTEAHTYFEQI